MNIVIAGGGSVGRFIAEQLVGGGHDVLIAQRERIVFDWCRRRALPVAFVLAGGYVGPRLGVEGLVGLHRLTLEAAAGAAPAG